MKKLISIFLVIVMIFALVACGGSKDNNDEQSNENSGQVQENVNTEADKDEVKEEESVDNKKDEKNPANETENKPEAKPETKPEEKPAAKPETEAKPETKPEEKPVTQASTAGEKLLADFKAKAGSSSSATALAEALSQNSIIPFMTAATPVEQGFLAGFGNTEIKGFKEGAMFGPMIGSVPFVGYVFVLEDGVSTSDFISTLKSNADLRWNICVEAEEMVAGSAGNKVFFVMCNKDLNAQE